MRAPASKVSLRARSWQSQRTTRRSLFLSSGALELAEIVFQPVPAQSGQTSARILLNFNPASSILLNSILLDSSFLNVLSDFATGRHLPASAELDMPVYNLCRGECGSGGLRKTGPDRTVRRFEVPRRDFPTSKPALPAPLRDRVVQNRLPARIFTVDFLRRERRMSAIRFPNSDTSVYPPGVHWVCKTKRPARRNTL